MDVVGFLSQHGFSGLNSVLLALLFILIRSKLLELDDKVKKLWDWHLIHKGEEKARNNHQQKEYDDE